MAAARASQGGQGSQWAPPMSRCRLGNGSLTSALARPGRNPGTHWPPWPFVVALARSIQPSGSGRSGRLGRSGSPWTSWPPWLLWLALASLLCSLWPPWPLVLAPARLGQPNRLDPPRPVKPPWPILVALARLGRLAWPTLAAQALPITTVCILRCRLR